MDDRTKQIRGRLEACEVTQDNSISDLIANAPADIAYLLERAERLREVIARNVECAHYATGCDCGSELRDALDADDAERRAERLRDFVVPFAASKLNTPVARDARAILAAIERDVEDWRVD